MKLQNAIKKLSKHGEIKQNGRSFNLVIGTQVIEFRANGAVEENPNITCIRVRNNKDNDDVMTDYSAGVWCDNLSQALCLVR